MLDAAQSTMHRLWCMGDTCAMLSRQHLHAEAHPEDRNVSCSFQKVWAEACMHAVG